MTSAQFSYNNSSTRANGFFLYFIRLRENSSESDRRTQTVVYQFFFNLSSVKMVFPNIHYTYTSRNLYLIPNTYVV